MTKRVFRMSVICLAGLGLMGFAADPQAADRAGGIPWWGWVLIILAVAVVAWLICRCVRRRRASREDDVRAAAAPVSQPIAEATVVPAPVAPAAAPAVVPIVPDDLKKMEGIGPKVASILNLDGIETFSQLATTEVVHLRDLLDGAKLPMIDPSSWAEQAALAAEGKWEELSALQDELKGGRKA